MTVEAATFISQLQNSLPGTNDNAGEGDDHLRLIKDVLLNTIPLDALVTATAADLNTLAGAVAASLTPNDLQVLAGIAAAGLVVGDLYAMAGANAAGLVAADIAKLAAIVASATEINHTQGVTGPIQTQLNGKAPLSHTHDAGDVVSGTLTVPQGGTGQSSLTANSVLLGGTTVTGAIQQLPPGTAGDALITNGAGNNPSFQPVAKPSDFFNGSTNVFPDAGSYTIDTGFGDNNFQWGLAGVGISGNYFLLGTGGNTGAQYMTIGAGGGTAPGATAPPTGHVRLRVSNTAPSVNIPCYIWARRNL